jgi:MinD-like ATPase involved in chromosome partitioning or flagellar assembly
VPPEKKSPRDPKRRPDRDRVEYVSQGLEWLEDQFDEPDESQPTAAPDPRPATPARPSTDAQSPSPPGSVPDDASWRPAPEPPTPRPRPRPPAPGSARDPLDSRIAAARARQQHGAAAPSDETQEALPPAPPSPPAPPGEAATPLPATPPAHAPTPLPPGPPAEAATPLLPGPPESRSPAREGRRPGGPPPGAPPREAAGGPPGETVRGARREAASGPPDEAVGGARREAASGPPDETVGGEPSVWFRTPGGDATQPPAAAEPSGRASDPDMPTAEWTPDITPPPVPARPTTAASGSTARPATAPSGSAARPAAAAASPQGAPPAEHGVDAPTQAMPAISPDEPEEEQDPAATQAMAPPGARPGAAKVPTGAAPPGPQPGSAPGPTTGRGRPATDSPAGDAPAGRPRANGTTGKPGAARTGSSKAPASRANPAKAAEAAQTAASGASAAGSAGTTGPGAAAKAANAAAAGAAGTAAGATGKAGAKTVKARPGGPAQKPPKPQKPSPAGQRPGGTQAGLQGLVTLITGGRLRPRMSEEQRARLEGRIAAPIGRSRRIAMVALKGGVGKTTTTACLGAVLAEHRQDRIVAVDANPDAGTLGYRIRLETTRTAKDLLAGAGDVEGYADMRAHASQTSFRRLEVIASDVDPMSDEAFGEDDYRDIAAVLERFYGIVLTDCGPGLLHSAMRSILPTADELVVISAASLDGSRAASLTLDWLEKHDYAELARNAVVVINAVRPRSLVDVDQLHQHFDRRCRAVVQVPFDRHLETGSEIVFQELAPATRQAYLELAAAVIDGIATERV